MIGHNVAQLVLSSPSWPSPAVSTPANPSIDVRSCNVHAISAVPIIAVSGRDGVWCLPSVQQGRCAAGRDLLPVRTRRSRRGPGRWRDDRPKYHTANQLVSAAAVPPPDTAAYRCRPTDRHSLSPVMEPAGLPFCRMKADSVYWILWKRRITPESVTL